MTARMKTDADGLAEVDLAIPDSLLESAVDRVDAYKDRAARVRDTSSDSRTVEHAQGAFEYFKWVAEDLRRITDPAARAMVDDVVLNLIRAFHHDWRAGIQSVRQPIESGARAIGQRREAGFSSGEQRAAERRPAWNRWQIRFDELRAANPRRSKSDICKAIAKEEGLDPSGRGVAKRVNESGTERPRSKK